MNKKKVNEKETLGRGNRQFSHEYKKNSKIQSSIPDQILEAIEKGIDKQIKANPIKSGLLTRNRFICEALAEKLTREGFKLESGYLPYEELAERTKK